MSCIEMDNRCFTQRAPKHLRQLIHTAASYGANVTYIAQIKLLPLLVLALVVRHLSATVLHGHVPFKSQQRRLCWKMDAGLSRDGSTPRPTRSFLTARSFLADGSDAALSRKLPYQYTS